MKISKNFTLEELLYSDTAKANGIDQTPTDEALVCLTALCQCVLQPVRDNIGTVMINSGYRSEGLNNAIGGSKTSQHSYGEAADIESPGFDTYELAQYIANNLMFDQLILEFYEKGVTNSGWVHVSFKRDGTNRKEILTAIKDSNGKTKYLNGFVV